MPATLDLGRAEDVVPVLDAAASVLETAPHRHGSLVRLPAAGRLLVTGDLHDHPVHLAKVVAAARLDEDPSHHLVLHELIHGDRLVNDLDLSYRILVRVAELVSRHPAQVHPLLANHELAQLTGRAVSKGGGDSTARFDAAIDWVFAGDAADVRAAVHRFIAAMPLALRSDSGVFCAHSLPSPFALPRFDTAILDRPIAEADRYPPSGSAYMMVWGRGADEATVEALAAAWEVRLFCLGHDRVDTGIEARGRRVVVLNTDHDRAVVLPVDLAAPPTPAQAIIAAIPLAALPEA